MFLVYLSTVDDRLENRRGHFPELNDEEVPPYGTYTLL